MVAGVLGPHTCTFCKKTRASCIFYFARKHRHLHFRNPSVLWWGQFAEMDEFLQILVKIVYNPGEEKNFRGKKNPKMSAFSGISDPPPSPPKNADIVRVFCFDATPTRHRFFKKKMPFLRACNLPRGLVPCVRREAFALSTSPLFFYVAFYARVPCGMTICSYARRLQCLEHSHPLLGYQKVPVICVFDAPLFFEDVCAREGIFSFFCFFLPFFFLFIFA